MTFVWSPRTSGTFARPPWWSPYWKAHCGIDIEVQFSAAKPQWGSWKLLLPPNAHSNAARALAKTAAADQSRVASEEPEAQVWQGVLTRELGTCTAELAPIAAGGSA